MACISPLDPLPDNNAHCYHYPGMVQSLPMFQWSHEFVGETNKDAKMKVLFMHVYLRTLKLLGRYLKRFFSKSPMFLFKISSLSLHSANSSADAGSNN